MTTAARGRHNRARLAKLNDEFIKAGLSVQQTLTAAEHYRKQLRAAQRAATTPDAVKLVNPDDKRAKQKAKEQKRKEAAEEARIKKATRHALNKSMEA